MAELSTFAQAVRKAETGSFAGNYAAVRGRIRKNARLLGAYGVASDEWPRLAAEAGYSGARWQDPRAQDAVVQATFDALHAKYHDWRLVAIAWKAGEAVADMVAANPGLLKAPELREVREYAAGVMRAANESTEAVIPDGVGEPAPRSSRFPVSMQNLMPADGLEVQRPPTPAREALTGMLRAMRNRQRKLAVNSDTQVSEPGEEVMP